MKVENKLINGNGSLTVPGKSIRRDSNGIILKVTYDVHIRVNMSVFAILLQ